MPLFTTYLPNFQDISEKMTGPYDPAMGVCDPGNLEARDESLNPAFARLCDGAAVQHFVNSNSDFAEAFNGQRPVCRQR